MAPCAHRGELVLIGPYTIVVGGLMYFTWDEELPRTDIFVLLAEEENDLEEYCRTRGTQLIRHPVPDFGIPKDPEQWKDLLAKIHQLLGEGKTLFVACGAGHGRTGMFLACLLHLIEPEIEDLILETRQRYCSKAVETAEQEQFCRQATFL